MAESKFVGVIVGFSTGEVKAVINPDADHELDNPRWLLLRAGEMPEKEHGGKEAMVIVKVPRAEYMNLTTPEHIYDLARKHRK